VAKMRDTEIDGKLTVKNGFVGIGVNDPMFSLTLVPQGQSQEGSAVLTNPEQMSATLSVQGAGYAYIMCRDTVNDVEFVSGTSTNGEVFIASATNHDLSLRTQNTKRVVVKASTGYTGFLTVLPFYPVDVNGDIRIRGDNKLRFGGTGGVDSDVELSRGAANVLFTPDTFKAGGYQSGDGTVGKTEDVQMLAPDGTTIRTLHFKNGLYTGYTDS
jgi:hypothetical protein